VAHDRDEACVGILLDGLKTTLDEVAPVLAMEPEVERGLPDDMPQLVLLERAERPEALASVVDITGVHSRACAGMPVGRCGRRVGGFRQNVQARARHSHVVDPIRKAQAFFAGKAQAYRESPSHADRADLARMAEWLAPRAGERALDVATGGGHTALALRAAGCDTLATDATRAMLDKGPPVPRAVCDAERLPFRRGSFDIVASRIAPHHFPDLPLFAQEVARVLRQDGRLYVFDLTTPEDASAQARIDHVERLRDPSHGRSYPPSAWRAALAKAGLQVRRMETRDSTFDLDAWIARARMPAEREGELRRLLRETPPDVLGGYGVTFEGKMRVLRVELLASV